MIQFITEGLFTIAMSILMTEKLTVIFLFSLNCYEGEKREFILDLIPYRYYIVGIKNKFKNLK